jgi:hypothetical protein
MDLCKEYLSNLSEHGYEKGEYDGGAIMIKEIEKDHWILVDLDGELEDILYIFDGEDEIDYKVKFAIKVDGEERIIDGLVQTARPPCYEIVKPWRVHLSGRVIGGHTHTDVLTSGYIHSPGITEDRLAVEGGGITTTNATEWRVNSFRFGDFSVDSEGNITTSGTITAGSIVTNQPNRNGTVYTDEAIARAVQQEVERQLERMMQERRDDR